MAKGNTFSQALLKLIFQAVNITSIADNTTSSPLTNLYVSLHTANPGPSGDQTTSEAAYGSYTRIPVARTTGGFSISNQSISPVSTIVFPLATSGSETETYYAIGTDPTGPGTLLYSGTILPTILVNSGVTPQLSAGSTI